MGDEMKRAAWGLSVAILVSLATLSACSSSAQAPLSSESSAGAQGAQTVRSNLGVISYCVGTSARHKSGQTVRVTFMRGSQVLGQPSITVPMRISVQVSPGPYSVVVDGKKYMWGAVNAGETASGTDGANCPSM